MNEPRLRLSALLTGLAFVVFICAVSPYNNAKLQNSPLGGSHFPLASFAALLFLLGILNPVLSLVRREWRFNRHELLLVWSMVTVSTGVAYIGLMRTFIINITTPVWFTTTTSNLAQVLLPYLPSKIFPKDPDTVKILYSGMEGGLDMPWWHVAAEVPWGEWLVPMAWWGLFICSLYMAMLGLAGLFTHQWIENEKMNFPLLRVPEILGEESENRTLLRFLTHRYFIVGCALPVFLHTLNGLHAYFPEVPQIPALLLAQPYIPREGLLSGYSKLKIYIFPAFIGFAFLTSRQVSFSLWFFFILGGLVPGLSQALGWRLPAAAVGTTFGPVLSRVEEMQMIGAVGVFFFFIVWLARNHLQLTIASVFSKSGSDDYRGFLSPRPALFLFAGGLAGAVLWLYLFGMGFLAAILFLAVCFMIQLVSSRLVCQGGLPYFTLTVAPSDGFLAFLDTRLIAPVTLYLALVVQKIAFLDVRESLSPSLFHSSTLSEGSRPRRRFLWGVVWAILLGLIVSFAATLVLYYKFGISSIPDDWAVETTRRVHESAAQLLTHPEEPKKWSIAFMLVGAGLMSLLIAGYHHFIWWPLHPIGYLTAYSSAMQLLWFGFLVGWLCNTLVLRYGGANRYKEVRRFFVGLIFGDMIMAIVWLIAGFWTPISYHVLPL